MNNALAAQQLDAQPPEESTKLPKFSEQAKTPTAIILNEVIVELPKRSLMVRVKTLKRVDRNYNSDFRIWAGLIASGGMFVGVAGIIMSTLHDATARTDVSMIIPIAAISFLAMCGFGLRLGLEKKNRVANDAQRIIEKLKTEFNLPPKELFLLEQKLYQNYLDLALGKMNSFTHVLTHEGRLCELHIRFDETRKSLVCMLIESQDKDFHNQSSEIEN